VALLGEALGEEQAPAQAAAGPCTRIKKLPSQGAPAAAAAGFSASGASDFTATPFATAGAADETTALRRAGRDACGTALCAVKGKGAPARENRWGYRSLLSASTSERLSMSSSVANPVTTPVCTPARDGLRRQLEMHATSLRADCIIILAAIAGLCLQCLNALAPSACLCFQFSFLAACHLP